jgi:hypothetical protein
MLRTANLQRRIARFTCRRLVGNGVRVVCGDCLKDTSFRAGQIGYDEIQQGILKLDRNGLRFANVRDRNVIRRGVRAVYTR